MMVQNMDLMQYEFSPSRPLVEADNNEVGPARATIGRAATDLACATLYCEFLKWLEDIFLTCSAHSSAPPLSAMEGDRGMVAVVEGLRDAGLAVTLLSRRFRPRAVDRAAETGHYEWIPADRACQTAVGNDTKMGYKKGPNNHVQRSSCQTRYGNQLAHSRTETFMPAYLDQYATQGFMQYRVSTSRSPETEAFVDSLRKYPASPLRSRSADLIERMLTYTQNKHGSKYANTRSAKSLPSKEALKKLHFDEIPTKDTTNTKNDVKPNFGFKRDAELIPVPTRVKKKKRDDQITMFDYLKSLHKDKKLKEPEVRYLTNMKQCIRETIRQLCDEDIAPKTICPKLQNRYNEHKKRCHKNGSPKVNHSKKVDNCTTCRQSMARDTIRKDAQNSPIPSKHHKTSFVEKCLGTLKDSKVCLSERPKPTCCKCKMSASIIKQTARTYKHKQCRTVCEDECSRNDSDCYAIKLKENVFDWLQEIPVLANFSATDVLRIQEIANQLINNLNKIGNDMSNLNKIEDEIKKCLKMLPMWRSQNKSEQESIENQIAQKLLKRIKKLLKYEMPNELPIEGNDSQSANVNNKGDKLVDKMVSLLRKEFDSEKVPVAGETADKQKIIKGSIDKLKPITLNGGLTDKGYKQELKSQMPNELSNEGYGSRSANVNNKADKLVDELVSLLQEEFDSEKVPFTSETVDKEKLMNDLMDKLKPITLNTGLSDKEYKQELKSEKPNKLPIEGNGYRSANVNNKADKLVDELVSLLQDEIDSEAVPITGETADNQKLVNDLIDKLKPITLNGGLTDEGYKQELKSVMPNDLLIKANGPRSANVNNKADKLVDELVSLLQEEFDSAKVPFTSETVDKQKLLNDLMDKLKPITLNTGLSDKEYKQELKSEMPNKLPIEGNGYRSAIVNNRVDKLVEKRMPLLQEEMQGKQHIDSGTQGNLANKLIANIKKEPKVRDSAVGKELISKKNLEWLEAQPEFKDKTSQLRDMVTPLVMKLQHIKNTKGYVTEDDIKAELNNLFEKLSQRRGTVIDSDNQEKLQDMSLTSVGPIKRGRYWEKPKSMVTKEIKDALNDTPITLKGNDKERLKEQLAEVITKDWNTMQPIRKDELLSNIIHVIKSATSLPESQINSLAQIVTNKVKEDILPNLLETIELDKSSKNKLKEKLKSILAVLPLNDKEKVIDAITDTLMKHIKDDINGKAYEEILEELKKANVDNNTAKTLTSDILETWHQFKDEFNNKTFRSPSYESAESSRMPKQMYMQRLRGAGQGGTSEETFNQYNKFKIPPFTASTPIKSEKRGSNIEDVYKNQIKEIIKQWIPTLELNGLVDETFKDSMATDIATDIIDRKRYLQLSKIKPLSQDELEHLKYQVFKWTSKLPNQTNLPTSTSKLKTLIKSIEALDTPNLIKERSDSKKQQRMSNLHDLVENLEKHMNGGPNANMSSKKDAIKRAVQNWCQTLPLKRGIKYSDIKDIVNDLAEAVSRYLLNNDTENANTYMNEILNNLRKLPLQFAQPEFKDKISLRDMVKPLVMKLQDIKDTKGYVTEDDIKEELKNWSEKLPQKRGTIMDSNNQEKLQETPLTSVGPIKRRRYWEKPKSMREVVTKEITDALNDTAIPLKESDKKRLIEKLAEVITKDWNTMQPLRKDELLSKIIHEIKSVTSLLEAQINSLAQTLTNKVKEDILTKLLETFEWPQFKDEFNDTAFHSQSYESAESSRMPKQMYMQRLRGEGQEGTSEDSLNQYNKFKIPPFTASTPIKSDKRGSNIEDAYKNQIKEIIKQWIPTLELNGLVDETFKDSMATDIATDIIDRKRYLQLSKIKPTSQDELEHLKYQVFKWISKVPNQTNLPTSTSKLKMLIKSIEALGTPNLIQERTDSKKQQRMSNLHDTSRKKDAIKRAVQNWCQTLPLKRGIMYSDIKDIVNDLAEAVSRYFLNTDIENINTYMNEIFSNLRKLPLQFDKDDSKNLLEYTEQLIETLKEVLNDSVSNMADDLYVKKPASKKFADTIYDKIQNWCENLPLELDFANEDSEQIKEIKQNLANILMKKVGELNLDPEIFHDDKLYEDILKDEIEQILESLPKNKQLEELLPTLKRNLAKDILAAKDEMKNELAGFAYKQQVRDAISKTLSSISDLVKKDDQTSFEILKDNLADAFISLYYVANDEELKQKFKEKIFNEINKFCNDYLKQNLLSPCNVHQLNQELYNALKRIPVPKEESMRREVEQIRIKDLVNDWLKKLPLEDTPSNIQNNKIISILAKRLNEIENEAALNSAEDIDERMHNEILKWLKKFKLKAVNEKDMDSIVKTLINKLKATEHSRKSINYADSSSALDEISRYPPSMLSTSDRADLLRKKARTSLGNFLQPKGRKDELQKKSQNSCICIQTMNSEPATQITPQVIVKEYYWDSNGCPVLLGSDSVLSYVQPPAAHVAGCIQPQATIISNKTSYITSASQTIPQPQSKSTLTQDAIKVQCKMKGKEISQEIHCKPDDYLQLNLGKKGANPSHPGRERAVISGDLDYSESDEPGPSKAYKHTRMCAMGEGNNEETCYERNRCAAPPCLNVTDNNKYFHDEGNKKQLCFRRPICHSPVTHPECLLKSKRKRQQHCTYKSPTLPKCTIRPLPSYQHSDKSCYVAKKRCPKCWDGFCPYPSFLYFRPD